MEKQFNDFSKLLEKPDVSVTVETENSDVIFNGEAIFNPFGNNMLCLQLQFDTNEQLTYDYIIYGKTTDTDFHYTHSQFETGTIAVNLIGLIGNYSNGQWSICFTNKNGTIVNRFVGTYSTTNLDYTDHLLHIDIEITNQEMADSTINNGWLFIGYGHDVYDKNGDLRISGLSSDLRPFGLMKMHDGCIYIPAEYNTTGLYNRIYKKMKLTGEVLQTYTAPDNMFFHHDIAWDKEGYMYALGTPDSGTGTVEHKIESIIYKFKEDTGELVTSIDYSDYYYQASILKNSIANDCHFNSLTYIEEFDQLLVNSHNSSNYFTIDKYSLLPIWNVDNPAQKLLFEPQRNLTVTNDNDEFIYPNGEHTAFVTYLQKYEAFRGEGKIVLSLFDNVTCKDESGNDLEKECEDPNRESNEYPWDSAIQVVAIDLHKRTVTQLERISLAGYRSNVTSSVFDTVDKKYFQIFYGVNSHFFVIDTDGNIGVAALNLLPPGLDSKHAITYRAKVFMYNEIQEML